MVARAEDETKAIGPAKGLHSKRGRYVGTMRKTKWPCLKGDTSSKPSIWYLCQFLGVYTIGPPPSSQQMPVANEGLVRILPIY